MLSTMVLTMNQNLENSEMTKHIFLECEEEKELQDQESEELTNEENG